MAIDIKHRTIKRRAGKGFTLIEVSLFLALTGLVLMGMITTFSNINRQRYNDSVQNFTEYLRNLYSRAANIQNSSCKDSGCSGTGSNACCGQSNSAIYGVVATFNGNDIKSYNVSGRAHIDTDISDVKLALSNNPVINGVTKTGANIRALADSAQTYNTLWQASIQMKDNNKNVLGSGSVLIVRSPNSGTIHTFLINTAVDGNSNLGELVKNATVQNINFCVNSEDAGGEIRNVRIKENAHNASGVELVPVDSEGPEGSAC